MKQLFASATLKLTSWYLLILMTISLLFSVIIYTLSLSEISTRLDVFESRIERIPSSNSSSRDLSELGKKQLDESNANLLFALILLNSTIFIFGGVGSYKLARRSLKPIEVAHDIQSRFTSDASHELRTPLAVMKSELEVILREKSISKDDLRDTLISNLEEVNRLSSLAEVLLQFARYEQPELEKEKINISELISKLSLSPSVDSKRISLHVPKKPIYITANEASIQELILILVDNAQRYSPVDSTINIRLQRRRSGTQISIENTGGGIPSSNMPFIFDRFYRVDESRTGNGSSNGYGLGLSLAKRIADLHSASIEISSQPNIRTTAVVNF